MFISRNANMDDIWRSRISLFIRVTKENSTIQKCNTISKEFISYTILRNYLAIINPNPINIGVDVTISNINALSSSQSTPMAAVLLDIDALNMNQ